MTLALGIGAVTNLLIAIVFLIVGLAVPGTHLHYVAIPMFVVGGVLGYFTYRGMRGSARDAQLAQSGLRGVATILSADQTGLYVNYQPQVRMRLRVSIPGRPDYETTKSEVVSLLDLASIQPGSRLAVAADPADPSYVVILGSAQPDGNGLQAVLAAGGAPAVFDATAAGAGLNSASAQLAEAHLQQSGVDGTGTVMAFEDLGVAPSGNHNVKYDILIAVPGQQPYTLHKESELPAAAIPLMQVGKTFSVKVDLANREHPMIAVV